MQLQVLPLLLHRNNHPNRPAFAAPAQPVLDPKVFARHAACRFSLAFQCVVNVGVRGSETIRTRIVQVGTLNVVVKLG